MNEWIDFNRLINIYIKKYEMNKWMNKKKKKISLMEKNIFLNLSLNIAFLLKGPVPQFMFVRKLVLQTKAFCRKQASLGRPSLRTKYIKSEETFLKGHCFNIVEAPFKRYWVTVFGLCKNY